MHRRAFVINRRAGDQPGANAGSAQLLAAFRTLRRRSPRSDADGGVARSLTRSREVARGHPLAATRETTRKGGHEPLPASFFAPSLALAVDGDKAAYSYQDEEAEKSAK